MQGARSACVVKLPIRRRPACGKAIAMHMHAVGVHVVALCHHHAQPQCSWISRLSRVGAADLCHASAKVVPPGDPKTEPNLMGTGIWVPY